jgi:hypothetical protein
VLRVAALPSRRESIPSFVDRRRPRRSRPGVGLFGIDHSQRSMEMAKTGKPNVLIIWGDDIGWFNVSA